MAGEKFIILLPTILRIVICTWQILETKNFHTKKSQVLYKENFKYSDLARNLKKEDSHMPTNIKWQKESIKLLICTVLLNSHTYENYKKGYIWYISWNA